MLFFQSEDTEVFKADRNKLFPSDEKQTDNHTYHIMAPTYLVELLSRYIPARNLRSSNMNLLEVPTIRTKTYGQRAFSYAAPYLWNQLPECIKNAESVDSFKRLLKTYLFKN